MHYFVKEKRNLFPFNVWALGDIIPLPDLDTHSGGSISYQSITDCSQCSNYQLKLTVSTSNTRPYVRYRFNDVSDLIGKQVSYAAYVKTTEPLKLGIYQHDGSSYSSSQVDTPGNTEDIYSVSSTVSEDTVSLWIGVEFKQAQNQGAYFYTDNWSLMITQ